MKLARLHRLAKPGLAKATMLGAVAGYAVLTLAAEPSPTAPLITMSDLMEGVLNPAASELWNAALIDPPEGSDKPVLTDEQWLNLRHNALSLLTAPPILRHPELQIAAPGTRNNEGELQPEAIAALRESQAQAWNAQVTILQQGVQSALTAIEARDLDAMLQAGDVLYSVCESCHVQFWYPSANP